MKRSKMVVWEVLVCDYADAKEKDRIYGGVLVYQLPVRGRCYVESADQSGMGDDIRRAAESYGREIGLSVPGIRGAIRASETIDAESVRLFREIAGDIGTEGGGE